MTLLRDLFKKYGSPIAKTTQNVGNYFGVGKPGLGQFGSQVVNPVRNVVEPNAKRVFQNVKDLPIGLATAVAQPFMTGEQILKFNPKVLEDGYAKRMGGTFFDVATLPLGVTTGLAKMAGKKIAQKALPKLAKWSATRGAEAATYGGVRGITQGEKPQDVAKNLPVYFVAGAVGNMLLSPRLTAKAGKELGGLAKQEAKFATAGGKRAGFAKLPDSPLSNEAGGEIKVVWQGNKEGGQTIGNKQIIRKPTLEDFKKEIMPRTQKGWYGTGTIEQQYKNMLQKEPDTLISFVDTGNGFKVGKIDSSKNILGEIASREKLGWAKTVQDFNSPEAIQHRGTFDSTPTPKVETPSPLSNEATYKKTVSDNLFKKQGEAYTNGSTAYITRDGNKIAQSSGGQHSLLAEKAGYKGKNRIDNYLKDTGDLRVIARDGSNEVNVSFHQPLSEKQIQEVAKMSQGKTLIFDDYSSGKLRSGEGIQNLVTPKVETPPITPKTSPQGIVGGVKPVVETPTTPTIPIKTVKPAPIKPGEVGGVKPTTKPSVEIPEVKNIVDPQGRYLQLKSQIEKIRGQRLAGKINPQEANRQVIELNKQIKQAAERAGVAMKTLSSGKKVPAVRKSGVFVEKELETYDFKDVGRGLLGGKSDNFKSAAEAFDNRTIGDISKKGWGPMAKIRHSFDNAVKKGVEFVNQQQSRAGGLAQKYGISMNRKTGEQMREILMGKTEGKDPRLVKLAEEMRTSLDELRNIVNPIRKRMGKSEIGYIDDYVPFMQKVSFWKKQIPSDKTRVEHSFDYVIPNQIKNPHAIPRTDTPPKNLETNMWKLYNDYVEAISNDIHISPQIEKLKSANEVLKGRGYKEMPRFIDNFIQENIIGQTKGVFKQGSWQRSAAQGIIAARNTAALSGNPVWSVAVQPLSAALIPARAGGITHGFQNTIGGLINFATDKALRQKISNLPAFVIKTKGATLHRSKGGDVDILTGPIYKTAKEKFNAGVNIIGNEMEKWLSIIAGSAGYRDAARRGLKGKAADMFADHVIQTTQSMYNKQSRPQLLNHLGVRLGAPFQTYAAELYRYQKQLVGAGGGIPIAKLDRLNQAAALIAGLSLAGLYSKNLFGRTTSTIGSGIPIVGSAIDETIQKGKEAFGLSDKQFTGSGKSLAAPQEDVKNIVGAFDALVNKGNWQPLRKEMIKWGMGFGGLGGSSQVNRLIDGLIASSKGFQETRSKLVAFPVEGTMEKAKSMILGPYGTEAGKKYIDEGFPNLGDKQSELFKAGALKFEDVLAERKAKEEIKDIESDKKPGFLSRITGKKAQTKEVDGFVELSNGKFYSRELKKDFDTKEAGQRAVAKDKFIKENKTRAVTKSEYDLTSSRLKNSNDIKGWLDSTSKYTEYLQNYIQILDPESKEYFDRQKELDTLIGTAEKYAGYGGFTKPKVTKSGTAKAVKIPKRTFVSPKLSSTGTTGIARRATRKVALPQVKRPKTSFNAFK